MARLVGASRLKMDTNFMVEAQAFFCTKPMTLKSIDPEKPFCWDSRISLWKNSPEWKPAPLYPHLSEYKFTTQR